MKSMNVQIYSTNNSYYNRYWCSTFKYITVFSGVDYNYRLRKFEKNADKKTSIIINACFFVLYELLINKFVNYNIINRKQNNTNPFIKVTISKNCNQNYITILPCIS